ncbi:hypothetical protein [Pseudoalteromonas rubra]|uniref:Uncharacterized protein n=1 Tax=Pseudoalteromonas rubra TaxID=43658 RepID=A0A5S3WX03_9GAMM|nr:hypothetical protein [Pseudoalteromonas rubra]TMP35047.1 hypothetical protein CWB98_17165 [Pseudoalteromonas rubra]
MRFITSKSMFLEQEKKVLSQLIEFSELPEKLLAQDYRYFLIVDFSFVLSASFYNAMVGVNEREEGFNLIYHVLDPEPEHYYRDHIEKYKSMIFSGSDSVDDFISALNEYSGGLEPDCIMDNSDIIMAMSDEVITIANREVDYTLIGFKCSAAKERFERGSKPVRFYNFETAKNLLSETMGDSFDSHQLKNNYF